MRNPADSFKFVPKVIFSHPKEKKTPAVSLWLRKTLENKTGTKRLKTAKRTKPSNPGNFETKH